ncbi:hypothetical protein [Pseudomonas frederiksbergensis]|uniref:hypothetical protein n=1 Tax=Pseudomonas frederiksbergensis TaxID=104087 RepID=UPI00101ADDE8|nr:hypothetical protein [Pseudomonas frederiksbergensis]
MKALAFYAQALDNRSSDTMLNENSEIISVSEQRQKTLSKISHVTADGKLAASGDGWKIFHLKNYFVAQITTSESDSLGRSAPIVCLIDSQNSPDDVDVDVDIQMKTFLSRVNRTVDAPRLDELLQNLRIYQKKRSQRDSLAGSMRWIQEIISWIVRFIRSRH